MNTSTNNAKQFLGLIKEGVFDQIKPNPKPDIQVRFTSNQPQESLPPESGELNLNQYEGQAIVIRGLDQGGWIYSAEVIDTAGPILSSVVEKLFLPSNS